ncbi:MAG: hypothetical protein RLZZ127_194 [Planctomycetota bacterium]|jgi:hypothetical protein
MLRTALRCVLLAGAALASIAAEPGSATAGYIAEAPLADGWPEPGVPDAISEAVLPAHRAVEGPGFWPLFLHITAGEIPMTAPVVMPATGARARTMRFVYPRADTEPAPAMGGLRIVDAPPQRVLRLTRRGPIGRDEIAGLIAQLRDEAARRGLSLGSEPWLCGYNSPGIPRGRQTWELMLPVAAP